MYGEFRAAVGANFPHHVAVKETPFFSRKKRSAFAAAASMKLFSAWAICFSNACRVSSRFNRLATFPDPSAFSFPGNDPWPWQRPLVSSVVAIPWSFPDPLLFLGVVMQEGSLAGGV